MSKIEAFGVKIITSPKMPKRIIAVNTKEKTLGVIREQSPGIWQWIAYEPGAKQEDGTTWIIHPSMCSQIERPVKLVVGELTYGAVESLNLQDEVIKFRDEMLGETDTDFHAIVLLSNIVAWIGEAIKRLKLE